MNKPLILPYLGALPKIDPSAWISPTSTIIGDVAIGPNSSIWFGAIVRGDVSWIRIGDGVNIQDGVICHVLNDTAPLILEDRVSVGHGAILHGCTLKRGCLVGIGAIVLDHAVIGEGSLIAAGSVVRERQVVPPGELWAGTPAVKKRELSEADRRMLLDTAERYIAYRLHYMGSDIKIPEDILPWDAVSRKTAAQKQED